MTPIFEALSSAAPTLLVEGSEAEVRRGRLVTVLHAGHLLSCHAGPGAELRV